MIKKISRKNCGKLENIFAKSLKMCKAVLMLSDFSATSGGRNWPNEFRKEIQLSVVEFSGYVEK